MSLPSAPPNRPYSGSLITFEGVEGAGKTTQISLLKADLRARGFAVSVTREPGGDPVAEAIRSVLLDTRDPVVPSAELLLFMASRAQMVEHVLRPRLDDGEVVLCDRFTDSSIVYQGYGRGIDLDSIRLLNAFATGGIVPDRTLVLDLPALAGLARQTERNRMEDEALSFHERVRAGYLEEARREPGRIRVINAARSVEAVHSDVLDAVTEALDRSAGPAGRETGT
jgi:dTMP kinase